MMTKDLLAAPISPPRNGQLEACSLKLLNGVEEPETGLDLTEPMWDPWYVSPCILLLLRMTDAANVTAFHCVRAHARFQAQA